MNKKIEKNNNVINKPNKYESNTTDNQLIMKKNANSGSKKSRSTKVEVETNLPKRRGRRPKKILDSFESTTNVLNTSTEQNNSAVILRLPKIDPSKLSGLKNKQGRKVFEVPETTEPGDNYSDNELSEGMFRNDIPKDDVCHKCIKYEKEITHLKNEVMKLKNCDKTDKTSKIHNTSVTFISLGSGKKMSLKKQNLRCLWDCHKFDNIPCYLPELYNNGKYYVIASVFCSFNCALAHNLYYIKDSKIDIRKSLVFRLYRELYGLTPDEPIELKEAPPKELLEDFGGKVNIIDYRRSFIKLNKEFIVYMPPLKPIGVQIVEHDTDTDGNDTDRDYVLKRNKPLMKGRGIVSMMGFNK
nr:viral transcription factor 2 [Mimivirus pointerouge1]